MKISEADNKWQNNALDELLICGREKWSNDYFRYDAAIVAIIKRQQGGHDDYDEGRKCCQIYISL